MRYLAALVLVACGGHAKTTTDAALPLDARVCPSPPQGLPMCNTTCGNAQLDECYTVQPPCGECVDRCYHYPQHVEVCDGATSSLTCAQDGYFDGSAACSTQCTFDDSGCTACITGTRVQRCDRVTASSTNVVPSLSTTGAPRLAINGTIVELAAQGTVQIATPGVYDMAGTPTGWIGASFTTDQISLSRIALDGTVTAGAVIAKPVLQVHMAHGPTNRTIVVWQGQGSSTWEIWFAIVDDNAALTTQPTLLAAGNDLTNTDVASDGTSFFVGYGGGTLARIAADGTVATMTGFPSGSSQMTGSFPMTVRADSTGGWYVVTLNVPTPTYAVQRFDPQGAPVGAALSVVPDGGVYYRAFAADGARLVMGVAVPMGNAAALSERLEWIDATGSIAETVEVGRGTFPPSVAALPTSFLVAFPAAGATQLAVVSP